MRARLVGASPSCCRELGAFRVCRGLWLSFENECHLYSKCRGAMKLNSVIEQMPLFAVNIILTLLILGAIYQRSVSPVGIPTRY
jgi:hypothetical protein